MSEAPDTYLGAVVDFDLALETAREKLVGRGRRQHARYRH
jgi:hypothetical protein